MRENVSLQRREGSLGQLSLQAAAPGAELTD